MKIKTKIKKCKNKNNSINKNKTQTRHKERDNYTKHMPENYRRSALEMKPDYALVQIERAEGGQHGRTHLLRGANGYNRENSFPFFTLLEARRASNHHNIHVMKSMTR